MPDKPVTHEEMIEAVRSAEALAEHHVRYWSEYPQSSAYLGAAAQLAGIRAVLTQLEASRPLSAGEKIITAPAPPSTTSEGE